MDPQTDVQTGEFAIGARGAVLSANGIGSCIVFCIYDPGSGIGGLAHAMLPGRWNYGSETDRAKHAADAVGILIERMRQAGADSTNLVCALAGGGNVLRREDDTICRANVQGAWQLLSELGIPVFGSSLGGMLRRRVKFMTKCGTVLCAVGDGPERVLARLGAIAAQPA